MSDEEAEAKAARLWPHRKPHAVRRRGHYVVGWHDDEWSYSLGIGESWEEAFAMATRTMSASEKETKS